MNPEHDEVANNVILLVDKPAGITSHDVVAKVRRVFKTRKVGHAGTLDPMATGLMTLGINNGTKILSHLVGMDKVYLAQGFLGFGTTTDDAEGERLPASVPAAGGVVEPVIPEQIRTVFAIQVGNIAQIPSTVSAIKVNGVRSYKLAREGQPVELAPRDVTIHSLELLDLKPETIDGVEGHLVTFRVHCSSGTYVRAIARDVGLVLGVGGHLRSLRRERIGDFSVEQAVTLEYLQLSEQPVSGLSLGAVLSTIMPVQEVGSADIEELVFGRQIDCQVEVEPGATIAICDANSELIAVGFRKGTKIQPKTVFK